MGETRHVCQISRKILIEQCWDGGAAPSFNFIVHGLEPPEHQAQPALLKNLGTRAHSENWTCFSLAVHARQSLQLLSKSVRETPCSLWKVSVAFHDPGLLEGHL